MKHAYVLVDGNTDKAFLWRVLPQDVTKEVEIVAANGSYNIPSLARTLLVERHYAGRGHHGFALAGPRVDR